MYYFDELSRGNYSIHYEEGEGLPINFIWKSQGKSVTQGDMVENGNFFTVYTNEEIQGPIFSLLHGITVSGRVQDMLGEPLSDVRVYIKSLAPSGQLHGDSKSDGTFSVQGLSVSQGLTIEAMKDGYLQSEPIEGVDIPEQGRSDIVITIKKAG